MFIVVRRFYSDDGMSLSLGAGNHLCICFVLFFNNKNLNFDVWSFKETTLSNISFYMFFFIIFICMIKMHPYSLDTVLIILLTLCKSYIWKLIWLSLLITWSNNEALHCCDRSGSCSGWQVLCGHWNSIELSTLVYFTFQGMASNVQRETV